MWPAVLGAPSLGSFSREAIVCCGAAVFTRALAALVLEVDHALFLVSGTELTWTTILAPCSVNITTINPAGVLVLLRC